MDINYEYYKVYYYVGKYRNITKAAQALGGSQPNVTRVIKLLEDALGCQLLLRSNKGITFTEKGELLYERVSAAFCSYRQRRRRLAAAVRQRGRSCLARRRRHCICFFFRNSKNLSEKNPKVRFKIYNYSTKAALEELTKGAVEICVVTSPVSIGRNFACKSC